MVVRQLIALPSQLQLIDRLQHHIYLSSSLILLSGEQGSGKSTLLEQLTNKLPKGTQEAFIQLNGQLSDAQIRKQVLLQLYENPLFDDQDSLVTSLSLLQEKYGDSAPRLIVFDNAQYLSEALQAELGQLIAQKTLFGENEINVLLLIDNTSSRKVFSSINQICTCLEFKLEALSEEESKRLLNHVFQQAGYQHQIQNQDAVSQQLSACQGIPQRIIGLAEKIIAGRLIVNESSWLKQRLPAIAIMVMLLAVAGGLGSYLYSIFIKSPQAMVETKVAVQVKEPLQAKAVIIQQRDNNAEKKQSAVVMAEELAGSWKKERTDIDESHLQVGISDTDAKADRQVLGLLETEQLNTDQPADKSVEEPVITKLPIKKSVEITETVIQSALETEPDSALIAGESKQEIKSEPVLEKASPEETKEPDSIFTEESKLLSVSPLHYTLQLSAMATQRSLQRFITEHDLPKENVYIYQSVRDNKPRYVVIFGEYESWAAARKASNALPGSLANLDSWIKKYQLVHQDLQLNNE